MSKVLLRLRSLFADPLLVRTPRGMALTAHAMALAEPLQRALSEVRRVVGQDSPFDPASVRRTVALASVDLQELLILPALLPRLRQSAPGIDLRVRATDRMPDRRPDPGHAFAQVQ